MSGRRRVIVVCALMLAVAVGGAPLVEAASNATGPWSAYGHCEGGTLTLRNPDIHASPATPVSLLAIWSPHDQWVAYRAWLFYSSDAKQFTQAIPGDPAWRTGVVIDAKRSAISFATDWYDTATGSWNAPDLSWNLSWRGYYRIVIEIYWYPDAQTDSGYVETPVDIWTANTAQWSSWCTYL